jgi:hypothetical protein
VTVTATRDRQSDLDDEDPAEPAWDERPIVGSGRGLPWWAAILLAFGIAAIAAWIDMQRQDSLGRIYQGAYVLGCIGAVCWVRRRNLFGPMIQPPLVFAITAIGAVAVAQPGPLFSTGMRQLLFSVALPLTSNFPTMAITTGVCVALGLVRMWLQRDPEPRVRPSRSPRDRDPLDPLEDRPVREPGARRPRDRSQPDRGPGQRSGGRTRAAQDPPGGARLRTNRGARPDRADPPDQLPRAGRSRLAPGSDPAPRRQPSGDQPPRRSGEPGGRDPARRPLRRRPPDA